MNSATNVQPVAGHGNGSVETQNQPLRSASSSRQISSSDSIPVSERTTEPRLTSGSTAAQ